MACEGSDDAKLVNSTFLARNFPAQFSPVIEREHLLDTLSQVPSSDTPVVFLEGSDGAGATTLLAQFATKHHMNCFALFIKPASRIAYSPDYLRMILVEQIWFYLHGSRLDQDYVDVAQYESVILQLRKRMRSGTIFILVDGIHQISKDESRVAEIFTDVLPVGIDGFRFIITGHQDQLAHNLGAVKSKPYQLLKFSEPESKQILVDLDISTTERDHLLRLCEGNPGRPGSVRRLIQSGTSAEKILQSEPDKYLGFLNLEFSPISNLSETQRLLLATLAFSRHMLSLSELLEIVPSSTDCDVEIIITSCTFVSKDNDTNFIEFISEAHRRLAENSLKPYKQRVLGLHVNALIREPESSAAVRLLLTYYQSLNQQQAIVDLLSKEHYCKLLETTQSIAALKARAALGAKSAMELRQATEVLQFSLHRSIFSSVGDIEELQSEVSSLVALGQSQRALDIAAQSATKEKRLYLLAEYARRTREMGASIDPQIVAYIRELAVGIDFPELTETATRLAENLLFVDPDLALSMVENALKSERSTAARDAAFANLSVAAAMSKNPEDQGLEERPRSRIGNERLQELMASFNSIVADFSFDEICKLAKEMEIGRRIELLRHLVVANEKRDNILEVIEFALDQLIANTAYSPKARDLADLALPLSTHGHDINKIRQIVKRLEGQIGLVQKGAPSSDIVRLQMNLAHAEMVYDIELAKSRITDSYFNVASMENADIKVLCLATMSRALVRIDRDGILEGSEGFRSVILKDLQSEVESLLNSTASHFLVSSPLLVALASHDPLAAIDFVPHLNNESRRDLAYSEIACNLVSEVRCERTAQSLQTCISRIVDPNLLSECIHSVVKAIARSKQTADWAADALRLLNRHRFPEAACDSAIEVSRIGARLGDVALVEKAANKFNENVIFMDSLPDRVNANFKMSAATAATNVALATSYYEAGLALKASSPMSSSAASEILCSCLFLLLRTFRGLMKGAVLPDDYIDRFSTLCEQIPCSATRASLYGELACKAWCEGRTELVRHIVNHKCRPLLSSAQDNPSLYSDVCDILAPAMYCAHPPSAFSLLENVSKDGRGNTLVKIALMVLRKTSPSEPKENVEDEKIRVDHETLIDLYGLLEQSPTDWCFYSILSHTAQAATQRDNRTKISGQQRVDFSSRVNTLISKKLPDQSNILHAGYVVISKARLLGLQLETKSEEWTRLVTDADSILNIADRAFVLLEIVQCMPSKFLAEKKTILKRAHLEANEIPSSADRYSRLELYIRTARKIVPADAKAALKEALLLTFDQSQPSSAAAYRRSLVDLAEAMESDLVDQLAEMIDDDPARSEAKTDLKNTVEVAKLRKKLAATTDNSDDGSLSSTHLPSASWKNLSALVSGRLETKPPERMMKYVNAAGGFTLRESYPVLSWFIENCTRRFTTVQDISQQIVPLSEVLLLSTEIAVSVIAHAPSKRNGILEGMDGGSDTRGSFVVRPGERDVALNKIRQWLRQAPEGDITYCDPYFCQTDVDFLRIALAERPESKVRILTSLKAVKAVGRSFTSESFVCEWSESIDQDPPETEIVAVTGFGAEEVLVHDRWLIVGLTGLRLGTSFGSLGLTKLSEISHLNGDECLAIASELDQYFSKKRFVNNVRVSYASISI